MAEFTKGPWFAIDREPASRLTIRGGHYHYPIAKVQSYWDGPGPRSSEALANCDLIAAAPELYELLERFVRPEGPECDDGAKALDALAKARGETQ